MLVIKVHFNRFNFLAKYMVINQASGVRPHHSFVYL